MTAQSAGHYIRHNKRTSIPRTYFYLDSEARRQVVRRGEVQTFRLAVVGLDQRYHHRDAWKERTYTAFYDPAMLWAWVHATAPARSRSVLVAHNLAYDLRICDAFTALPALGWTLKAVRLDGGQVWATWRDGRRSLFMVDSLSWLAKPLAAIGELLGIPKLPLPDWADDDLAWEQRCARDTQILGDAWRRLMEWVVYDDLGNWKPTGAGQAFAAFRHRFMTHRLLVHTDADAHEAERRSAYTGRTEAWRHGVVHGGAFSEWDMTSAYASIGATCDVPTTLVGSMAAPSDRAYEVLAAKYRVLSDCVVTTEAPTVPASHHGRMLWPVGQFRATLWENEVALARANGATVAVERAWTYKPEPALRAFCTWCLSTLADGSADVDPIVRLAVKHWSRALIGRFGARWSSWDDWALGLTDEVALSVARDPETGDAFRVLQLGRQMLAQSAVTDAPGSMPAIMAWVMAQCRVDLWQAMTVAGFDHVAYVDTDSLIVDAEGSRALAAANVPGLRPKGSWRNLEVLGPRQIVVSGELRAAGIPRLAQKVAERTYRATTWQALSSALATREPDRVRLTDRSFHLAGTDLRRRHLDDGSTLPYRLTLATQ